LAASANAVGAWFAAIVAFWKGHYFVPGAAFALGLGLLLLIPLVAIAFACRPVHCPHCHETIQPDPALVRLLTCEPAPRP